jgi:site-specific DNA recombinase
MRVAVYARVSTEAQEAKGTIGSQLAALRDRVTAEGHNLIGEFIDDGHSGARLDRPGLDALRDAAEAGLIDAVWCLSPDRLARVYAYQVIVLDELARHGVAVCFADAPAIDDDPQARLLTQVQGVIAEYERAKIAERYRRGKLWRSRTGEVLAWKTPYGYRRVPRNAKTPAHLEVFEPEAAVVRRIFDDYVAGGYSTREITRRLNADGVATPSGKAVWGTSTIGRLLHNEAYIGQVYWNKTESVPDPRPGRRNRQVSRPREDWVTIAVPAIVTDEVFETASRVTRDNSKWSPRNAQPGAWLLRSLVRCGTCGVGVNCHNMRGRNGTSHRYYYCRNHDPLRAGGQDRRCPERNIRSDELDTFVFDQVRDALLRPEVLLAGEYAVAAHTPTPDDELLGAQLSRLERKAGSVEAERGRLVDLYQAGLIELIELQRRAKELDCRRSTIDEQRQSLTDQRAALAKDNRLRQRIGAFAERAAAALDGLDFEQRQKLLRLVIDEVRVTGWNVEIRLRIPLDDQASQPTAATPPTRPNRRTGQRSSRRPSTTKEPVSSNDRLRSGGVEHDAAVQEPVEHGAGDHRVVVEDLPPTRYPQIGRQRDAALQVSLAHNLEQGGRGFGGKREVANFIDDQQPRSGEETHGGRPPSFEGGAVTPPRQIRGGGVVGAHPGGDRGVPEADGEHGLADSGRADEQHVGGVLDEAQGCELGDEFRIDGGLCAEVEVGECERRRQRREPR